MKQNRLFQCPEPVEEGHQSNLVALFCFPDTPDWRRTVVSCISLLAYGRSYDEQTGSIRESIRIGEEILNSMSMCNLEDLVSAVNRVADQLQVIGTIPGSGDTIQETLWDIRDGLTNGGMTLDEIIALMEQQRDVDPNNYDFKDWLEMLTYIKELTPNLGQGPIAWAMQLLKDLRYTRFLHTQNTLMAYQATSLRGIQNALAPFKESETEDEESIVSETFSRLDRIPWVKTAVIALVDPSPTGETALAAKVAATAASLFNKLASLWTDFIDTYINQVGTPQPTATVTGQLAVVAKAIEDLQLGNTGESGLAAILSSIAANIASVSLECNCGAGGGCTCAGGGTLDSPDIGEGDVSGGTLPEDWAVPTDEDTGVPLTPGMVLYQQRKCRAANLTYDSTLEMLNKFAAADIPNLIESLGIVAGLGVGVAVVTTVFVSTAAGPLILAVAIIGLAVTLVKEFFSQSLDVEGLATIFGTVQEEFVCALYNATSAEGARAAIVQVLQDAGASQMQRGFVVALVSLSALGNLMAENLTPAGQQSEAQIRDYVGGVDCSACSNCGALLSYGQLVSDTGTTLTATSLFQDGSWRVALSFNANLSGFCGPTVEIEGLSVTSGAITDEGSGPNTYRFGSQADPVDVWDSDAPPAVPLPGVGRMHIRSSTEFTIQISYQDEV